MSSTASFDRNSRRRLRRQAEELDRLEARLSAVSRDAAAISVAANLAHRWSAELDAGQVVEAGPLELPAIADRHAARPRFKSWRPTSADPVGAAREVAAMLDAAAEQADAAMSALLPAVVSARKRFADAARNLLERQPATAGQFAAALALVGVQAAGELADVTVARFPSWLIGGGVTLVEGTAR